MINRLAELLLRANPQIMRALRSTYPFVFVDEFQDTTYAQYSLLFSAFGGGHASVTAVGDDKQRIMGWAGAEQIYPTRDLDKNECGIDPRPGRGANWRVWCWLGLNRVVNERLRIHRT